MIPARIAHGERRSRSKPLVGAGFLHLSMRWT
jgi:hypothetical protein